MALAGTHLVERFAVVPDRVLKQQSDRQPAGRRFPVRGTGLPLWAGPGSATRVPPPARDASAKTCAARTSGGTVPGPAGAKGPPGALATGLPRGSVALWQGRWPDVLHMTRLHKRCRRQDRHLDRLPEPGAMPRKTASPRFGRRARTQGRKPSRGHRQRPPRVAHRRPLLRSLARHCSGAGLVA